MSTVNRITGAVTGWDTDSMVKSLMKAEQSKLDKVKQDKQVSEWKKDAYKEFSSLLRGLQSEYFDVLKTSQNLRSTAMYNTYSSSITVDGATSTKVSAITSAESSIGNIEISSITGLASKDTWTSEDEVNSLMENGVVDVDILNTMVLQDKKRMKLTVDGISKEITLAGGYLSVDDLKTKLQAQIDSAFGSGQVTLGTSGASLTIQSPGHSVTFNTVDSLVLNTLGLYDGASNTISTGKSLKDVFGIGTSDLDFSINGVTAASLGITEDTTVAQLMDKFNSSEAGVTLRYSAISNKMTLVSNGEGAANNITLTDAGGFLSGKLKFTEAARNSGTDAVLVINGVATTRSSNTFTVDGTTVTLKDTHTVGSSIKVGVTSDTSHVVNVIKGFVDKYNELVTKLGTAVGEKRYYSYKPLTEEQREGMSEDDITLWESKAKSGLLKSDPLLISLQNKLRRALVDEVEGVGINMSDIGITTSANYLDNGKLSVNESKLKLALEQRPTEVIQLFAKQSSYEYSDGDNRSLRYGENGIANRLNDILNDNIRLSQDEDGNRGTLIDKAGSELNATDTKSYLAKQIAAHDKRIETLLELLADREEKYYNQFARMETALQKLNAQSASLISSMGGGS